ncbi:hypothetical protein LJR230_003888 [Trinickia sp. LjRoot230]|uniref:hypothetical protein n=1 Tax=Trinickia sp. LjRoot230 TaxID=3342288 RepID=UPI003ED0D282
MNAAYHFVLKDRPADEAAKLHGIKNREDLELLSALAEDANRSNHLNADFEGARTTLREGGAAAQFVIELFAIRNPRERRQLCLEEVIVRTMNQHLDGMTQASELRSAAPPVEKGTDHRLSDSVIYEAMCAIADGVPLANLVKIFDITDRRDLALLQPVADEAARWGSRAGVALLIEAQKRIREKGISPEKAAEELDITHRQDLAVLQKLAGSQGLIGVG